ncbi:MAG: gamma-glutamyltransferase family protein [Myxococcales bacterium]|nr:gamma-glutamyltransferase family protein [Myxococcales bacterium]
MRTARRSSSPARLAARALSSFALSSLALSSLVLTLSACDRGAPRSGPRASVRPQAPAADHEQRPATDPSGGAKAGDSGQTGPDDGGARKAINAKDALATGTQGAVTSAEANATDIGLAVLRRGGNAVDAAVAVGVALGVTHPSAGNIGGGGFMVIRLPDGTSKAIDYREMAPGKASRDMYLDAEGRVTKESRLGPRAAGVPGVLAGFAYAHKRWGSRPWAELVEPAVALARDGWALDPDHAEDLEWGTKRMDEYLAELKSKLEAEGATLDPVDKRQLETLIKSVEATIASFRKPDGSAYQAGDVWRQPALADTLEAVARGGAEAFYTGPLAKTMAERVQAMGGLWTAKDLAGYKPIERAPLEFDYRGYHIVTMPPPSAGGVVLRQVLAASEALELYKHDWDSVDRMHLYVEALRRTYADRNLLLGDPDFIKIPMRTLLDVSYMSERMRGIDPNKATPSSEIGAGVEYKESAQTTHFSVVDRSGMAISNTYTLNGGFGAKVQIPGTGVTMNNEMDDFTAKPGEPNMFGLVQGPQNAIAPRKRMLSSMTPTILEKDGQLRAVIGSPGGPTITTTVAQIVMQMIDHGRTVAEAVAAPRIHHQWLPDRITHEETLDDAALEGLRAKGHELKSWGRIGHANCIGRDPASGALQAVADVERDGGKAAAY